VGQEAARQRGELLKLRLPTKEQDIGLVLMDDYRACVAAARQAHQATQPANVGADVLGTSKRANVGAGGGTRLTPAPQLRGLACARPLGGVCAARRHRRGGGPGAAQGRLGR